MPHSDEGIHPLVQRAAVEGKAHRNLRWSGLRDRRGDSFSLLHGGHRGSGFHTQEESQVVHKGGVRSTDQRRPSTFLHCYFSILVELQKVYT